MENKLINEISKESRQAYNLPLNQITGYELPEIFKRTTDLNFPEVSELDVVRHFTEMSNKNYGVETGFYPLGSCTMKYNPKINEELSSLDEFVNIHPLQDSDTIQGLLQIYDETSNMLCALTGMAKFTFSPCAGAHGELTGLMIMKEYHLRRHDEKRTKVIVPNSAHGTNPASSSMGGFEIIEVDSTTDGMVDVEKLKSLLNDEVAGIMLTNPNTLGIFEKDICEIAKAVHDNGSLLYYDGANINAILGMAKPALMGFDIMHLNLHKSFSTPHGGGGPGSGPVGVRKDLVCMLPNPIIEKNNDHYEIKTTEGIGNVSSFFGNANVVIKAYFYLRTIGNENISKVAKYAVLNANYIKESLKDCYKLPISRKCMHEVVFDGLIDSTLTTLDVAKRLLDYGYHAPTIYFPLLFHQAMMIEPTETESKDTLDSFINVLKQIAEEAKNNPKLLLDAPHHTFVRRLDEVQAARYPILKFQDLKNE